MMCFDWVFVIAIVIVRVSWQISAVVGSLHDAFQMAYWCLWTIHPSTAHQQWQTEKKTSARTHSCSMRCLKLESKSLQFIKSYSYIITDYIQVIKDGLVVHVHTWCIYIFTCISSIRVSPHHSVCKRGRGTTALAILSLVDMNQGSQAPIIHEELFKGN